MNLALEKHFLRATDLRFKKRLLRCGRHADHLVAARFLYGIRQLIAHVIGTGAGAAGIGKHVYFRKCDLFCKRQRFRKFFIRFAREADHDVRRDGSIFKRCAQVAHDGTVFVCGVVAVHAL